MSLSYLMSICRRLNALLILYVEDKNEYSKTKILRTTGSLIKVESIVLTCIKR